MGRDTMEVSPRTALLCRRRACWVWLLVCGLVGCDQTSAPSAPDADQTPIELLQRMIELRRQAAYQQMSRLVVPERANEVIETLAAVDEFLLANQTLCDYVRDKIGIGLSRMVDQSQLGSNLEIFSRHLRLLDQVIDDDKASVSFIVAEKLPLGRASLVRRDGQWRYDPGAGYDAALPAAFRQMARGLRLVLEDLRSGRIGRREVYETPMRLVEEVSLRLGPGVRMLPARPVESP